MGNIFGRDPNTLNFNGARTENYSDNIPYLNKLQTDSRMLANNLQNNNDVVENRKMYDMFTAQQSDNNFSDTSPLVDTNGMNASATSAVNSEIQQLLNKIQKGGSIVQDLRNEPVNFVNTDIIQQLLTETSQNQTGGNINNQFVNEEMLRNLMTETNEQSGGFFWNKKKQQNETFINEETFKSLMSNADTNTTSDINTEMQKYMDNAITELTSALEGNQKGGAMDSEEESSSSSDSEDKPFKSGSEVEDAVMEAVEEAASGNSSGHSPEMSQGRHIYSSSSAHSNGINSNDSHNSSTVSANNDRYLSDSINTSDINMISVE
jgi:hypothetical protein